MRTLHQKLLRDFATMKAQIAAIAIVVGAGVMTLIISVTTLDALSLTRDRFYEAHQFAHVFAELKRAPDSVIERLREIPGINQIETRVRAPIRLEVSGFNEPIRGDILSLPDGRQPSVNRLYIREGRLPAPGRWEEVIVGEAFAQAHGLHAGDSLNAIIRGRSETLVITGLALSPEFVYQVSPSDLLPDYERYAVLWMNRKALASAYAMDGAFNNVVLTLQPGALEERVIEKLDTILARYGGVGAYGREDQASDRFLSDELANLGVMARILPTIFLSVAAFLLHMLMGRIVRTQRSQIAVLKAFGYTHFEIGLHYALLTGLIVLLGAAGGIACGAWAAGELATVYTEYFRFPELSFRLQGWVIALALSIAGGSAALGVFGAVRGAVLLPPAEAMRPPLPERFQRGWVDQSALGRKLFSQPTRIILRNLSRHPMKTSLSVVGIGLAGALILVGHFQFNAVDYMVDTQYRKVLQMDLDLTFTEATPERALRELEHLPGTLFVEGYRAVPVRLSKGLTHYRTAILGMDAEPRLRGLIDQNHLPVKLPPEGLFMTRYLAEHLGISVGEEVAVDVLEGHRRTLMIPLAGTVDEPVGVSAYMERRALNRILREGPALSGAWFQIDRSARMDLIDRLWEMPRVAGIGLLTQAETNIRRYMVDTVLIFMSILLTLAGSIAFAVIYNNARITLAERSRELATLRVLGFTQGEVAWILLGEIAFLTLLAIPIGWGTGTLLAYILNRALAMDTFRIPFIMTAQTYAFSTVGILLASILSALLMLRRLRRLDMVSALKTME